jgi:hypothetical protein
MVAHAAAHNAAGHRASALVPIPARIHRKRPRVNCLIAGQPFRPRICPDAAVGCLGLTEGLRELASEIVHVERHRLHGGNGADRPRQRAYMYGT